ncbi:pentapeptide repeat-containing protein [Streptomyces lanatus]|uniref:Pentapeptide repeat-containing protein n=1 Tax=Streptomyces lanatus TaxID=66900 RepID=A0ABV1XQZ0_9ACTN|nr:pentapeptide repeat-containing protein [Streptomyces lanatus]GHH05897.1 hypothetical protein GCM10018780_38070 [Streptomyces lanatus]
MQKPGAQRGNAERTQLKIISWRLVITSFLTACAITAVTTWILVIEADSRSADEAKIAAVKISAIRTGLSVGAGAGGAMALLLAARRQWLGERSQLHQEEVSENEIMDATERRITDLYGKAVDQLGSEKTAVRIGGILALERLAQANPGHRQTITEVICAYLRMPFPVPSSVDLSSATPYTLQNEVLDDEQKQEMQVRLTVQTVLRRHLLDSSKSDGEFWAGLRLDLTGASLITFNLSNCEFDEGMFNHASFVGTTRFAELKSGRSVSFRGANFHGFADFEKCHFSGQVRFDEASFARPCEFSEANFDLGARFDRVKFHKEAVFKVANFHDVTVFDGAEFLEAAVFTRVDFVSDVRFFRVVFANQARFLQARFRGPVTFGAAKFDKDAIFGAAHFEGRVRLRDSQFAGGVSFKECRFNSGASIYDTVFRGDVSYRDAEMGKGVTFKGVAFEQKVTFTAPQGGRTINFHRVLFNGQTVFLRFDGWAVRFWDCSVESPGNMRSVPYGWVISSGMLPSGRHEIVRWNAPLVLP